LGLLLLEQLGLDRNHVRTYEFLLILVEYCSLVGLFSLVNLLVPRSSLVCSALLGVDGSIDLLKTFLAIVFVQDVVIVFFRLLLVCLNFMNQITEQGVILLFLDCTVVGKTTIAVVQLFLGLLFMHNWYHARVVNQGFQIRFQNPHSPWFVVFWKKLVNRRVELRIFMSNDRLGVDFRGVHGYDSFINQLVKVWTGFLATESRWLVLVLLWLDLLWLPIDLNIHSSVSVSSSNDEVTAGVHETLAVAGQTSFGSDSSFEDVLVRFRKPGKQGLPVNFPVLAKVLLRKSESKQAYHYVDGKDGEHVGGQDTACALAGGYVVDKVREGEAHAKVEEETKLVEVMQQHVVALHERPVVGKQAVEQDGGR